MPNALHIAVTPWSLSLEGQADALTRQAVTAEAMGCHSFWLPENHFGDGRSLPSPLTQLAAVAACTRTIKLGTTSYLLPIRHPLQAAEEVAVLDRLSAGRVILGVGRGTQQAMFDAFGVETKKKRSLFKTNLDIMVSAWRGEPIDVDSSTPVTLAPLPVQRPHPPVWIAAFGPLALKQAGTLGLPYLASPIETLDVLADNYARHADFAQQAGHPPLTTVPVMRSVFVSNSRAEQQQVKTALQAGIVHAQRDERASIDDWTLIGDATFVRDKLAEYQSRLGLTHLIIRGRVTGMNDQRWIENLEQVTRLV